MSNDTLDWLYQRALMWRKASLCLRINMTSALAKHDTMQPPVLSLSLALSIQRLSQSVFVLGGIRDRLLFICLWSVGQTSSGKSVIKYSV